MQRWKCSDTCRIDELTDLRDCSPAGESAMLREGPAGVTSFPRSPKVAKIDAYDPKVARNMNCGHLRKNIGKTRGFHEDGQNSEYWTPSRRWPEFLYGHLRIGFESPLPTAIERFFPTFDRQRLRGAPNRPPRETDFPCGFANFLNRHRPVAKKRPQPVDSRVTRFRLSTASRFFGH